MVQNIRKRLFALAAVGLMAIVGSMSAPAVAQQACPEGTTQLMDTGVCIANVLKIGKPNPTADGRDVSLRRIMEVTLQYLVFIFGSIAMLILVICGFLYLFSAGDESQTQKAKQCIMYAIIGIFVAGGAFIIVKAIAFVLHGLVPAV